MQGLDITEAGVRGRFERILEAGEIIFDEGDAGDSVYVIQSGEIELTRAGADGERVVVDRLGAGEFFGEMSVVLGGSRTVRARALAPVRALELDGSTLQEMCVDRPEIALRLIRRLAARVIDLEKQVFALGADDRFRLVVRVLVRRARADSDGAQISGTLRDIAGDAGLPMSEVHRALQALFAQKLLRLRDDTLHTPDLDTLTGLGFQRGRGRW